MTTAINNMNIADNNFWAMDLGQAFAEVRGTGQYVLIAAGEESVELWKSGLALAFINEANIDRSVNFKSVIVRDVNQGWAGSAYNLKSTPNVVVCTPEGREVFRLNAGSVDALVPVLADKLSNMQVSNMGSRRCSSRKPAGLLQRAFATMATAVLGA